MNSGFLRAVIHVSSGWVQKGTNPMIVLHLLLPGAQFAKLPRAEELSADSWASICGLDAFPSGRRFKVIACIHASSLGGCLRLSQGGWPTPAYCGRQKPFLICCIPPLEGTAPSWGLCLSHLSVKSSALSQQHELGKRESPLKRPRCGLTSCFADSREERSLWQTAVSHWGRQWRPQSPQLFKWTCIKGKSRREQEMLPAWAPRLHRQGCPCRCTTTSWIPTWKVYPRDSTHTAGLRRVGASGKGDDRPCTCVTTCKRICCYMQLIASSTVVCKGGWVTSLAAVFLLDSFTAGLFTSSSQVVVQDCLFH